MDLAPQRRLAAIMFTDIVGYSRLMGADEARAMRLLDRHDAILGEQVRAHGGEIVRGNAQAEVADPEAGARGRGFAEHGGRVGHRALRIRQRLGETAGGEIASRQIAERSDG